MTQTDRLYRRAMMGNAPCTVLTTKDDGPVQLAQVQITAVETRDDTPVLYAYGFSSNPHPGAQGHLVAVEGDRSKSVVIAMNDRTFRLKNLQNGEVALYTDEGDSIVMRRGRQIVVTTQTLVVTGDLHVQGAIYGGYGTGDRVNLQTHIHTQPNDSHGDTEQPTGPPVAGTR